MVRQLIAAAQACRNALLGIVAGAVLLLAGCAAPAPQPPPDPADVHAPDRPQHADPAADTVPAQSATLALQQDSLRAAEHGDVARAIALLERAIRIDPRQPELWLDLARVHLDAGSPAEAEQFARRALTLTGSRYRLEQDAYGIIDRAQALLESTAID